MLKRVLKLLMENGFEKRKTISQIRKLGYLSRTQELLQLLSFKHIYINSKETEMYVICESKKIFIEEQIKEFEREIASFVIMLGNKPLAYNINLVLLCPLNLKKNHLSENNHISKLIDIERDKYNCRKFFLDTANRNFEEELDIIPSLALKIEVDSSNLSYEQTIQKIQEDMHPELFKELIKNEDTPDLQQVLQVLENTISNIKDDKNE
ncbi:hypothetical protein [Gottfriedia acidiceleris]|uniref:Uncharacterized protein n=1 Tax=Gottfriedia acidiceleris TaxID=371036 RepID=A0ABY4JSJ0_9BACI|nr:hypothetical protein [Gottfriedia acidiceleris]UPM56376.1 hypothetical protein MY490_11290 [Gottfriedia acidiceleris]